MRTANEIYNFLGRSIIKNAPQDWTGAELNVEVLPGFSSYNGFYVTSMGRSGMNVFNFPVETGDYLQDLHTITTQGGNNKWNKAKLVVKFDGTFDMEFMWDQAMQDEVDRRNHEEEKLDPKYSPPKWHWEK